MRRPSPAEGRVGFCMRVLTFVAVAAGRPLVASSAADATSANRIPKAQANAAAWRTWAEGAWRMACSEWKGVRLKWVPVAMGSGRGGDLRRPDQRHAVAHQQLAD